MGLGWRSCPHIWFFFNAFSFFVVVGLIGHNWGCGCNFVSGDCWMREDCCVLKTSSFCYESWSLWLIYYIALLWFSGLCKRVLIWCWFYKGFVIYLNSLMKLSDDDGGVECVWEVLVNWMLHYKYNGWVVLSTFLYQSALSIHYKLLNVL
jgi:hypothetical protein